MTEMKNPLLEILKICCFGHNAVDDTFNITINEQGPTTDYVLRPTTFDHHAQYLEMRR
jgi:hypothetical protein